MAIAIALAATSVTSAQENIAEKYMTNPDFEYSAEGVENTSGSTVRGLPYGWEMEGTYAFPGNSYGINNDGIGYHGNNLCWFYNKEKPMPKEFELFQTVKGLPAGTYTVKCLLYVQREYLGTARLFANNNVQYFGKESEYVNNLTPGEINTFAGYEAQGEDQKVLREMQVLVTLKAGDDLVVGIRTGGVKSDGSEATSSDDVTGWFKCDYFQIYKGDCTGISHTTLHKGSKSGAIYNLRGQRVQTPRRGLYIQDGRKKMVK